MYLFTSEVVSPGHPDKCADIIADTIVDKLIIGDSKSRVASEVFVAGKHVVIGGEVTSNTKMSSDDYTNLVKDALANIGYGENPFFTNAECLKPEDVAVQILLNEQSPDINQGVDQEDGETGAGDQGIMFGYADCETENYMPSAITYARMLMENVYAYAKENPHELGVGIGLALKSLTGIAWLFWVGVFIGIGGAIMNIYKVYEKQKKEYEDLAKEPRYAIKKKLDEEDDEDYGEKTY